MDKNFEIIVDMFASDRYKREDEDDVVREESSINIVLILIIVGALAVVGLFFGVIVPKVMGIIAEMKRK